MCPLRARPLWPGAGPHHSRGHPVDRRTELPAGESRDITVSFMPGAHVPVALYACRLFVGSEGQADLEIPVNATVTSADTGDARVYVYDPYIWQDDGQGGRIEGLEGARVTLQHARVYTLLYEGVTDHLGNCDFGECDTGSRACRRRKRVPLHVL